MTFCRVRPRLPDITELHKNNNKIIELVHHRRFLQRCHHSVDQQLEKHKNCWSKAVQMATDGIATGPFIGDCCVLYIVCAVSAAAGVGGGGIIVPILTVVFGIAYKTSTVLSSCTLIGNYFSQILVNSTKSHPLDAERPLIYWDLVLILLPCQLGGSNIGTVLNTILPGKIIHV